MYYKIEIKAIEFESEVLNNSIKIPDNLQNELSLTDKHVRVIVLVDDPGDDDELEVSKSLNDHFLKGYDAGDAIYDSL